MAKNKRTQKAGLKSAKPLPEVSPEPAALSPSSLRFSAPINLTCRYCGACAGVIASDVPERSKIPLEAFTSPTGAPITSYSDCACPRCSVKFYNEVTDKVYVNGLWL